MGQQQHSRINDALYAFHSDISARITAKDLASISAYSEQHFHRVFHKVVGETVSQYVRRTRLEQAANQLMFDDRSTVLDIAEKCGFSSLSSFSQVFKSAFGSTPGQWRKKDTKGPAIPYLSDEEIAAAYRRLRSVQLVRPDLVNIMPRTVAYVRHLGYGRSIRFAWQTLLAWAEKEQRDSHTQIGLHHSNPACIPLNKCRYVACMGIDRPILRRGLVNSMTIPGGLHAAFVLKGRYGELLPHLSKILEQWLPESGFKMKTTPAFVQYSKNQFLRQDENFELTFFLPISAI